MKLINQWQIAFFVSNKMKTPIVIGFGHTDVYMLSEDASVKLDSLYIYSCMFNFSQWIAAHSRASYTGMGNILGSVENLSFFGQLFQLWDAWKWFKNAYFRVLFLWITPMPGCGHYSRAQYLKTETLCDVGFVTSFFRHWGLDIIVWH